jgi:hypothetical protein
MRTEVRISFAEGGGSARIEKESDKETAEIKSRMTNDEAENRGGRPDDERVT